MTKQQKLAACCSVLLISVPALAAAQSSSTKPQYQIGGEKPSDEGPRGISVGEGLTAYPFLRFSLGRDDNLFLTRNNEKRSTFSILNPGASVEARREGAVYRLGWESKFGSYYDSSADNYQDHNVGASADYTLSSSAGLKLGINADRGHDPRGSTDRPGATRPDKYSNDGVNGLFAYGGNQARGRIELAGSSYRKRYDNNRVSTQLADRDTDSVRATVFARVFPKTSVIAEYRLDDFDYKAGVSVLDSKEKRYLAGVTWDATAATSGTIKAGRLKKEFAAPSLKDFSGSSWEVAVEWKPLTYSKVDLNTTKTAAEGTGVGSFTLSKRYGGVWTHNWTSKLSTAAGYNFTEDEYVGAIRRDEIDAFSLKVNFKVHRSLTLGADLNYTDRDSNLTDFRYKRTQFMVTLGASL